MKKAVRCKQETNFSKKKAKGEENIREDLFIDRTEARNLFWDTYEKMEKGVFFVINYYGLGGIGKSKLCQYLYKEIENKYSKEKEIAVNSKAILFSFEGGDRWDKVTVLKALANLLEEKCDYKLNYFNYALYVYYRKSGLPDASRQVQQLADNPFFNLLLDGISILAPGVGEIGSTILKNIATFAPEIKAFFRKNKQKICALDEMGMEQVPDKLIDFFIEDVNNYLIKEKEPLVIFLDAYEYFQNYLQESATNRSKDTEAFWCAKNGLIRQLPNILWVINGQKQLTWERNDSYWDEDAIAYSGIEELKEEDVRDWVKPPLITESEIVDAIVKNANGIPDHITKCIEEYCRLQRAGEELTPDKFDMGYQKLISRCIGGQSGDDKDMIEILACLEKWTTDDIIALGKIDRYEEYLKGYSYIKENIGGYHMQKQYRDIIYCGCSELIKKRTVRFLRDRIAEQFITLEERNDYQYKKVKLQLDIIAAQDTIEKKAQLAEMFFKENIEFIRNSIYDDIYYKGTMRLIKKNIPQECMPDLYGKMLKVYQLYRWNLEGDYESAGDTLTTSGIIESRFQFDKETRALLCLVMVEQDKGRNEGSSFYLEALDLLIYLKEEVSKARIFSSYANTLFCDGQYEDALRYCDKGLEILSAIDKSATRAACECEILGTKIKIQFKFRDREGWMLSFSQAHAIIKEFENTDNQRALLCFANILALQTADGIGFSDEERLEAAERALEISKKLYECYPNIQSKYNVANGYVLVAENLSDGTERKIECLDTAIDMLEEICAEKQSSLYLNRWFMAAQQAFEMVSCDKAGKYINICTKLAHMQVEGRYQIDEIHVYLFAKSLVRFYLSNNEVEAAYQTLNEMDLDLENSISRKLPQVRYLDEKAWILEYKGGICYGCGDLNGAYENWSEAAAIDEALWKQVSRTVYFEQYLRVCIGLVNLCMRECGGVCTWEDARRCSLQQVEILEWAIEQKAYQFLEEYVRALDRLSFIFAQLGDLEKANKIADKEEDFREMLSQYLKMKEKE